MVDRIYDWKRFWCPRDGNINLGDGGYMFDPDDIFGSSFNPDVQDYSSIAEIPCLVLLGEPGIGKSRAIQEIVDAAENRGSAYLCENLRQFGSEDRFVARIFDSELYRNWLAGDFTLELLFDSLDECLLRIGTIVPIMTEYLSTAPVDRLRLRIACRTAEWPLTLENALTSYWDQESFAAYELTPLRRRDVIASAEAEDTDPDHFLEEVSRVRGQPLAIKPVTLRFLLRTYSRNHRLPQTEAELYQQGCRLLCEESQERRDSNVPFTFDPEQRFAIAKRIAAVTVFSNKFAVRMGPDEGDVTPEDVSVGIMAVDNEEANGRSFSVTQAAIEETLDTGLFSSRGPNRIGWAHQTYAEFLAAEYLISRNVNPVQVLNLIADELSGQAKVVPQLHEVAARIAASNRQIFEALLEKDPEVLLRSDVATADDTQRENLVQALLDLSEGGEVYFRLLDYHDRLRHLNHPGLADQLRPFLANPESNINARFLALQITGDCSFEGLVDEMVGIACDRSANVDLRVRAIDIIGNIANEETKLRLVELAQENPEDRSNRVRGSALGVLWPNYIPAEQLFELMVPHDRENEINRYSIFVSDEITQHLSPKHLPAALRWVIDLTSSRYNMDYIFQKLLDGILVAGWEHMDVPEILPLFAQAICERIILDHRILVSSSNIRGGAFLDDAIKRRRLLSEVVPLIHERNNNRLYSSIFFSGLAQSEDLQWLFEQIENADSPELNPVWVRLCELCYDPRNTNQTELIIEYSASNLQVREAFKWIFETINLDSPEARAIREEYEQNHRSHEDDAERPQRDTPPAELIEYWLTRCENGEPEAWWILSRQLTITPEDQIYDNDTNPDITSFPEWEAADEPIRARIIEAAKQYILNSDDRRNEWLDQPRSFFMPAHAGYRALRLLFIFDPGFISDLDPTVWNNWVAALLNYPSTLNNGEAEEYHQPLMSMAYQSSPGEVIDALEATIRRQAALSQFIYCVERVGHIVDQRICERLRGLINERSLGPACTCNVIAFLVEHDDREAINQAIALVDGLQTSEGDDFDYALAAAEALSSIVDPERWIVIWQRIQEVQTFGRSLVERWARWHRERPILTQLTDQQLADLYIWVADEYPYNDETPEQIGDWRHHYLLNLLKTRGTFSACAALINVRDALPEAPWLSYPVQEALTLARTQNWQPLQPNELLRLVKDPDTRIISNGIHLLDIITDSLGRLEAELHSENPSVRDIWDHNNIENTWKPINENALSDYVTRFLRRDVQDRGIVVNREVEIRPGHGAPGERTDIYIDAVVQAQNGVRDVITCIIETKGCWHRELMTAMQTQLVDRYLRENSCRWGLYLVGWFLCEQWDDTDRRKAETPGITINEVRDRLSNQATTLSSGDLNIKSFVLDTRLVQA